MSRKPHPWHLSRRLLHAKYVLRWAGELPLCYLTWVLRSPDPLHKKMFWERLGVLPALPDVEETRVVIDTNGHGEYNQIHTFVRLFRRQHPDWKLILTSWNPEIVELALSNHDVDLVCFAPWDIGWITRRFLNALRPQVLIAVDQVRFPVLLRTAKELGIRTILVGASLPRIYVDSVHLRRARAYEFPRLFDHICVASEDDRDNYIGIGADGGRVMVTGSMKFDVDYLATSEQERHALKETFRVDDAQAVWIAGSVRRGEESLVLDAYRRLKAQVPGVRLILAPRYVRDVEEVLRVAEAQGVPVVLRSQLRGQPLEHGTVIILDTYGELSKLYAIADVVFIGNSLSPADRYALGQNLIEPLVHGKPVVFGPHMNKWRSLTESLKAAWPGLEVRDSVELAAHLAQLIQDPGIQARVTRSIKETIARNRMAVWRNYEAVEALLSRQPVGVTR